MIIDAGKTAGPSAQLYYCFDNDSKYLLKIVEVKKDFIGYELRNGIELLPTLNEMLDHVLFWLSRERNTNSKIKVKESKKKALKLIIEIEFGSISNFCNLHSINEQFLIAYLSGIDYNPKSEAFMFISSNISFFNR